MRTQADQLEQRFGIPNIPLGTDGTFVRLGKRPRKKFLPDGKKTFSNAWTNMSGFQMVPYYNALPVPAEIDHSNIGVIWYSDGHCTFDF